MYNAVQVKLLMKPEDLSGVPEFDEVFRDDEEVSGGFFHLLSVHVCHFQHCLSSTKEMDFSDLKSSQTCSFHTTPPCWPSG